MCSPFLLPQYVIRCREYDAWAVTVGTGQQADHWQLQEGNQQRCNLDGKEAQCPKRLI